jgi:hypothetical protein
MSIWDDIQKFWNAGRGHAQSKGSTGTPPQYGGAAVKNTIQNLTIPGILGNSLTNTADYQRRMEEAAKRQQKLFAQQNQEEEDDDFELPDYGGESPGVNVQALLDSINSSYQRQLDSLNAERGRSSQGIQGAYDLFNTNIGRNYADYQGAAQAAQAGMAQRLAQQVAETTDRQRQLQESAASVGQDYSSLQALQQGNLGALQASGGFQQDLNQRLAQIVANNQRSLQGSGDLIRQGAVGNLESNYSSMLNALNSSREQQTMEAQSAARSSGGGRAMTYAEALKEAKAIRELEQLASGKTRRFDGVSKDELYKSWIAYSNSDDEDDQLMADELGRELGFN